MQCYCASHSLYAKENSQTIKIDGKQLPCTRKIDKKQQQNQQIAQKILQCSSIYLPSIIPKISYHQITSNPIWFYKHFLSVNRPCIIQNAFEGLDIVQQWKNPKDLVQNFQTLAINDLSTSITPDGFADSIKNKYFVQPQQIKAGIHDIVNWGQKQSSSINDSLIPYVQHQNSNLSEQMAPLHKQINHKSRDFLSNKYFQSTLPDAQNFWMGFKESVSSIHKDPYQNFYAVVVGQKHFTLMPPISILYLQESKFINSKWQMKENELEIKLNQQVQTNWIVCNPDLDKDWGKFPHLSKLKDYHFHVTVQAGQMLYLPALWYHQVSQYNKQVPYIIAMNYWFDMPFNHSFSLFETARKIRNYD